MKKLCTAILLAALLMPGIAFAEAVSSHWVNETALVFTDTLEYRWVDAYGTDVVKVLYDFVSLPTDDTTGNPTDFTCTIVDVGLGDTTAALGTVYGGELVITCAQDDDDGMGLQLKGEAFKFEDGMPLYFGIRMKMSDATDSEMFVGLSITDTSIADGITDGVYFEKLDTATSVSAITEDAAETTTATVSTMDTSYHIYEFVFDGTFTTTYTSGIVKFYIDGALVATHTTTANICTDTEMSPVIEFTGGTGADTLTVDWLRVIQPR